jgi:putative RecB family exonuclease
MFKKEKEIRYSYSRLETYDQCPFRYFLKYIEGHYSETSSIALEFGTLVHATEEKIGNHIKAGEAIPYQELIKEFADKCVVLANKYPKDFIAKDKSDRTYEDKINYYLNDGIYRLERFMKANPNLKIVGTEVPFTFRYHGKEAFRGFIDRIIYDTATSRYIVQDIKTYAVPVEHEKLVTPLQFVVYCLAMCEAYPTDPTEILCQYDLPFCDITQDAGTKGFIARGTAKLDKLFANIYSKEWAPKQSPLCTWCDYSPNNANADDETKWLCPYHMNWTKERHCYDKENEWQGMERHQTILEAYHRCYGVKKETNNG